MIINEILFGSSDFRKECELRNKILRIPLGLDLFDEDLSREISQMHFGLFDDEHILIACAIAVCISPTEAKIRQMAVAGGYQNQGHGRSIIRYIETHLARQGLTHFCMHARMNAVGFYEKLGYSRVGPEFVEVGLPHIKMEKFIQP